MKYLIIAFLLMPSIALSQDCLKKENFSITYQFPCENEEGEVSIEFFDNSFDLISKNVALYRPDLNDFERNRVSKKGVIIEGNKLIFKGIEGGEYQVALYIKECSEFPKPILIPEEPIELYYSSECE